MKSRFKQAVAVVESLHPISDGRIRGATISYRKDSKGIRNSRSSNELCEFIDEKDILLFKHLFINLLF